MNIIFKNSRGTWKKINELLNKNENIVVSENRSIICNQKVVSNKFNNNFVNVAQNLLRELGEPKYKFQFYLKDPKETTQDFFHKETTLAEVQKLLNNINTKLMA